MVPKPPKIAIFWYPKAAIKLQSRSKAPKRHSKVAANQQSRKVASQKHAYVYGFLLLHMRWPSSKLTHY